MNRFAFVEKSLGLFEGWKVEHDAVMASYDQADLLDQQACMITAVYCCIEGFQKSVGARPRGFTASDARMLCKLSLEWHQRAREILQQVAGLEQAGFSVPAAGQLRQCLAKASGWIDSARKLGISLEEVAAGQYHSLDEAMDAIRL